jgi:hypothetical protein
MKTRILLAICLVALASTSLASGVYEQYGLEPVAIIIEDHDYETFVRVRDILSALGARGLCHFPPDAIFGYVPASFTRADMRGLPVEVARSAQDVAGTSLGAVESRIIKALLTKDGDQPHWIHHQGEMLDDVVLHVPSESVERTVLEGPRLGSAQDIELRNMQQNSEFLLGSVLINVIFPESQTGTESWTDDELAEAMQFISRGCDEFMQHALWTDLSFTFNYQNYRRVPVTHEPIEVDMHMDELWISEALDYLGYSDEDHLVQTHAFNKATRLQHGADWVFTAFVVDASENGCWAVRDTVAYSYYGGPLMVIPYPTCEIGDSLGMSQFFIREMGHIFWALYEEAAANYHCDWTAGYIPYPNKNSRVGGRTCIAPVNCVMNDELVPWPWPGFTLPVCYYSLGQMGLADADFDSRPDIYEVVPEAEFINREGYNLDTVFAMPYDVAIHAWNDALPNRNPYQLSHFPDEMNDYAPRLTGGYFSIDGSIEAELTEPVGGWNSDNEVIHSFPGINPGRTEIMLRFENQVGLYTLLYKAVYYIGIKYFFTSLDLGEGQIDLSWSTTSEVFGAVFDVVREDLSDGSGVDTIATVIEPESDDGMRRFYTYCDEDIEPAHRYRYRIIGRFELYVDGALRQFQFSTNDMYDVSLIPRGADFISNLLPNPTAGMTSFTVDIPKSWHDPSGGSNKGTVPASVASPALEEVQTQVEIHVYNIKGQRIHTIFSNNVYGETRTFTWHGMDRWGKPVAPGIYFIRVQAGGYTDTKKVVIIR